MVISHIDNQHVMRETTSQTKLSDHVLIQEFYDASGEGFCVEDVNE